MPQIITLPFHTVKLRLNNGEELAFPLTDPKAFHLGISTDELAAKFAAHFQKKMLDKGRITGLFDLNRAGGFDTKKIQVAFPKSPDGISYPDFELEFDAIYQQKADSVWGMVPALGLEALATSLAELEQYLEEVIRIEFSSKKRLQSVFQIIAASWYEGAEVHATNIKVKAWSPSELMEIQQNKQLELLPKVAEKMVVERPQAFGREEALSQLERILKGRFSRNALLVGASGTGKTALVQELVFRQKTLGITAQIWETTASVLIKELTNETGWQDNLSVLVKELTLKGDILFVRNLAELFEVGRYEGNSVSVAEYLRSAIGRGEVTLIGECTPEERARIELRSPGYLSFFQTVELSEPLTGLEDIILQKTKTLAAQRPLLVELEAVREILRLQRRFAPYSGLPGRPIRFLENMILSMPGQLAGAKGTRPATESQPSLGQVPTITRELVLRQFCAESGLPIFMVDPTVPMDLSALRRSFNANVFGQERAVAAVVDMMAAVKTALTRTGKPIASFLFAGPTGVGKTELAKVLAATMFGSRERMLRFDMSEYSSPWSVMRLTGEGYYSEGLLTNAVRRDPFCVLLFDEIEKADAKFYELLLQILSEGRLSDSRGRVVNFCSAIIIMTTNIGAANLNRHRISWKKELGEKDVTQHFNSAIEQHFRPELYNRIDAIVAFSPLDAATVRFVVEREIELLRNREGIRFRPLTLRLDESVSDYLAEVGYDARYGARYLQRAIREKLAVPLAEALNEYPFDERLNVHLSMDEGNFKIGISADPSGFDLLMEQWDRLTLAEKTSHQRRKIALLFESPLYLRYQSERDMLENEQERQTAAFWKNEEQAKRHAALEKGQVQAKAVMDEIQDMEVEIALACMGQSAFRTDFGERLVAWETSFYQVQTRLHSLIFPKRDTCQIGLYGSSLTEAIQFYLAIFRAKGFEVVAAQAVWFREGYTGEAAPESGSRRQKQLVYFYQPVAMTDPARLGTIPPQAGDKLCGIEMVVAGTGAWLYLREEKGLQQWEHKDEEEPNPIYVLTSLAKIKTPDEVHRQAFYANLKPRRHLTPAGLVDSKLNLATTLPPLENIGLLLEKLDEVFRTALTRAFLSSEAEE